MHVPLAALLLLVLDVVERRPVRPPDASSAAEAAAAPQATPDDAQIAKGLRNLAEVHRVARVLVVRQAGTFDTPFEPRPDAWGNPFRIEGDRIVSAGSDGKFEEGPLPYEQFDGLEGDLVFANGRMERSNRNWLRAQVRYAGESGAALAELREAEMQFMLMRTPEMRDLTLARITQLHMQRIGATNDAWGTPLRFEGSRIISAGADRIFQPEQWNRPPALSLGEDIIVEDGKVVRSVDPERFLRETERSPEPVPQPPDPAPPKREGTHKRPGGDVKPPDIVKRVEPIYPEEYRRARMSGPVIIEAWISEKGEIQDVRLLRSRAPELDAAAMEAVRQWTFKPATQNGEPIPVIFNLTVNFKLK